VNLDLRLILGLTGNQPSGCSSARRGASRAALQAAGDTRGNYFAYQNFTFLPGGHQAPDFQTAFTQNQAG